MAFRFLAYNKSIVLGHKGSHTGTCYLLQKPIQGNRYVTLPSSEKSPWQLNGLYVYSKLSTGI